MPRWPALLTYLTALILVIGISFSSWIEIVFPVWVFLISTYIMVLNYRYEHKDGVTFER